MLLPRGLCMLVHSGWKDRRKMIFQLWKIPLHKGIWERFLDWGELSACSAVLGYICWPVHAWVNASIVNSSLFHGLRCTLKWFSIWMSLSTLHFLQFWLPKYHPKQSSHDHCRIRNMAQLRSSHPAARHGEWPSLELSGARIIEFSFVPLVSMNSSSPLPTSQRHIWRSQTAVIADLVLQKIGVLNLSSVCLPLHSPVAWPYKSEVGSTTSPLLAKLNAVLIEPGAWLRVSAEWIAGK